MLLRREMRTSPRARPVAVAVVLVLGLGLFASAAFVACGGQSTDGVTPSSNTPTTDSSTGGRPADCPDSDPQGGSACSKDGLLCEYGDDFNPRCNVTAVCSGNRWARPIQNGSATCPSPPRTPATNPTDCAVDPKSFAAGMCSSKSKCTYEGAVCMCGVGCSNYPVRQRDCDPDAGVTTSCCDTTKLEWHCYDGPKYCATPRPRIGAACTVEGESCGIDEPKECGQTVMQCRNGIWDLSNTQCAVSSATMKREIAYVDADAAATLHSELMSVRLATYRYKSGDEARHLGFIIEDMPQGSAAVLPARDRVDLYGYVSMAVASVQQQQKEIDTLKADVARLSKENADLKRVRK